MIHESIETKALKPLSGLRTGMKWKASSSVDSAQEAFKLKKVMSYTQTIKLFIATMYDGDQRHYPESAEKWWFMRSVKRKMERQSRRLLGSRSKDSG